MTVSTTEMTAMEYMESADKELDAGNEREAARLLWKAAETTFHDLGRARGLDCGGSLIDLAKALEADDSVVKGYYRGSLIGASLLYDHARFGVLEDCDLEDAYEATQKFILKVRNGKRQPGA